MSHVSKLPSAAVSAGGDDLVKPTAELLRGLNLLPDEGVAAGPGAAFAGTPDSVAVIEAGATAFSKGWATLLGGSVVGLWSSFKLWWPNQDDDLQVAVVWGAALATAALVAGLAYIVGSDVRGRAAATVATINARSAVAQAVVREAAVLATAKDERAAKDKECADAKKVAKKEAAQKEAKAAKPEAADQVVPIFPAQPMRWIRRKAADEEGWHAFALRVRGDKIEYWLAKESVQEWVPSADVERV